MLHYLDDFKTVGPLDSPLCAPYLQTAFNVYDQLGLPLHPAKCAGPSPVLTILGTELESLALVARLAVDKFVALIFEATVHKTGARISHWSLASCCQGSLAWHNLFVPHD